MNTELRQRPGGYFKKVDINKVNLHIHGLPPRSCYSNTWRHSCTSSISPPSKKHAVSSLISVRRFMLQYHPLLVLFYAQRNTCLVIRSEVCGDATMPLRGGNKPQAASGIWSDFTEEQRWLTTCRIRPRRMLMGAWNVAKKWIGSQRDHVFWRIALNYS